MNRGNVNDLKKEWKTKYGQSWGSVPRAARPNDLNKAGARLFSSLSHMVSMLRYRSEREKACSTEKVFSEECGSSLHFYYHVTSWQVAETPFVNFGLEKHTFVALQKLPLLENGNTQTISL